MLKQDNIILEHELVKVNTEKHIFPRHMVKIVLQKAYDSVEQFFLDQILTELGFPSKSIGWILEYV